MKGNKEAGPGEIVMEMLIALEAFGIEKITEVINELYSNGEMPGNISKSNVIALPTMPCANDQLDDPHNDTNTEDSIV